MKTVICFGEALIRYQSLGASFFSEAQPLQVFPGGSEANVAVKLSQLGVSASFVSAAPDNEITQDYLKILQEHEVDISNFIFTGDRMGGYLLLSANGLSKGEVVYDRKYSAFSQLKKEEVNWSEILENTGWLHWTALTPALNPEITEVLKEGLQEASRRGIPISVDLNYRNKLWQYGKTPLEVMPELVSYCQVVMGNIWAAHLMLGTPEPKNIDETSDPQFCLEESKRSAQAIFKEFPRVKYVANTFRFMKNPKHNKLFGTAHSREEDALSQVYETHELIDRIGSGDAFMAGFIAARLQNENLQQSVELATQEGFKKLFVLGDFGKR